jgi:hypothetical protein
MFGPALYFLQYLEAFGGCAGGAQRSAEARAEASKPAVSGYLGPTTRVGTKIVISYGGRMESETGLAGHFLQTSSNGAIDMNRKLTMITTALFATALTGAALAGGNQYGKDKVSFNDLDSDGDGVVSMSELDTATNTTVAERLTQEWSALDTNQDGSLDRAEFAKFEPIMNANEKAKIHADEKSAVDTEEDDY